MDALLTQLYFSPVYLDCLLSPVYRAAASQSKLTQCVRVPALHARARACVCARPTRVLNWCNDGEREQFPFLPTSWWRCSEGPGGRQFIMCPSPWPCHRRNRQAHVCMNYAPSHLGSPPHPPASPPPSRTGGRFDTEGREHGDLGVWKSIKVRIYFVHQELFPPICAPEQKISIRNTGIKVREFSFNM